MEYTGHFVVKNAAANNIWQTKVTGVKMVLQKDDHFLMRTSSGVPIFKTDLYGQGGTHLVMQTDGNLVQYKNSGGAIWASKGDGNR